MGMSHLNKKLVSIFTFPGKWSECARPVPWLPCPPWWTLLDHILWGCFYKVDYIPWILTAAYQLQQCNTEVGNKCNRYATANIWSIGLWMVHLQNNQWNWFWKFTNNLQFPHNEEVVSCHCNFPYFYNISSQI